MHVCFSVRNDVVFVLVNSYMYPLVECPFLLFWFCWLKWLETHGSERTHISSVRNTTYWHQWLWSSADLQFSSCYTTFTSLWYSMCWFYYFQMFYLRYNNNSHKIHIMHIVLQGLSWLDFDIRFGWLESILSFLGLKLIRCQFL